MLKPVQQRLSYALVVFALVFHLLPRGFFHHCEHTHLPGLDQETTAMVAEACSVCDLALPVGGGPEQLLLTVPVGTSEPLVATFSAPVDIGLVGCDSDRGPPRLA